LSRFVSNGRTLALAAVLAAGAAVARASAPTKEIVGIWRGTSTCVKSDEFPACKDESVEFDVAEAAGGTVHLAAYKFVGGEKQPMGDMDFAWDEKLGAWTSEFRTARYHGLWTFTIRADALTGTLVDVPSGHKVRDIAARREKEPAK
jgi:hypothetical protein